MIGTTYAKVLVNSSTMTASDTVVRVTPASVAAAPTYRVSRVENVNEELTMAYSPGTIQSVSRQTLKIDMFGWVNSIHSIANPAIRPKHAPTAKDGMKIPANHQHYSLDLTYLAA
jgi:hypothetical protein